MSIYKTHLNTYNIWTADNKEAIEKELSLRKIDEKESARRKVIKIERELERAKKCWIEN